MNFPSPKQWRGMFPGFYTGEIWQTRNVDLDRSFGRVSLSDKMMIVEDSSDLTNLTTVTKFIRSNADATDRYYALCSTGTTGGRMFETASASPIADWAEDATTGVSTDYLDMEVHESANGEQRLIATRNGDIACLNTAGTVNTWDLDWGSAVLGLSLTYTSAMRHPIARLQRLIAIGDGNLLHTIDKNDVDTASRLVFPFGYTVRNIYASSDRFWIGLTNNLGGGAKIIEWDGFSLTYNNEYDLIGNNPLTGFIANNIPYFITNYGFIFKYMGGSFEPVQSFPIAEEGFPFTNETDIQPYGVAVDRHLVKILANHTLAVGAQGASRRFRSGIWEFNTKNYNLYHKHGLGTTKAAGTDKDFGQSPLSTVGGLLFVPDSNIVLLMAGGIAYTDYTGTTLPAIFRSVYNTSRSSGRGYNRGHFVTTYIPISDVEMMWEGMWAKFKRFIHADNRIVVKARALDPKQLVTADAAVTDPDLVVQEVGEWATTTTFTCAVPTGVETGDEVEVMSGNGAGCTFHISTLSATPDGTTSITVTVDEALPSLNGASDRNALFRFDNWVKVGTISSTTIGNDKLEMPEAVHGEFIQFKIELRGYDMQFDEIIPYSKVKTSNKQG